MKRVTISRNFIKYCSVIRSGLYFLLAATLLTALVPMSVVHAAGDASFSVSPTGGSYDVGSKLVVTVSETSSATDNTNSIQANLSYNTSLLTYKSIMLTGPFKLCGQESGGGGSVTIDCASTSAQTGTQSIAQITFTVISTGSAAVSMVSGSDIDSTSSSSVWDQVLPNVSYTLTTPKTSKGTASDTTAKSSAAEAQSSKTALSVLIENSSGQPLDKAKVSVDDRYFADTNARGKADFSGIKSGTHTIMVTDGGKKTVQQKVVLGASKTRLVTIQLKAQSPVGLILTIVIILCILSVAVILCIRYLRRRPKFDGYVNSQPPTIVVG